MQKTVPHSKNMETAAEKQENKVNEQYHQSIKNTFGLILDPLRLHSGAIDVQIRYGVSDYANLELDKGFVTINMVPHFWSKEGAGKAVVTALGITDKMAGEIKEFGAKNDLEVKVHEFSMYVGSDEDAVETLVGLGVPDDELLDPYFISRHAATILKSLGAKSIDDHLSLEHKDGKMVVTISFRISTMINAKQE